MEEGGGVSALIGAGGGHLKRELHVKRSVLNAPLVQPRLAQLHWRKRARELCQLWNGEAWEGPRKRLDLRLHSDFERSCLGRAAPPCTASSQNHEQKKW